MRNENNNKNKYSIIAVTDKYIFFNIDRNGSCILCINENNV